MNETTRLVADDLIVNLVKQQVYKKGVVLNLSDLSYRTLLVLLNNAPYVVSIEELKTQVWQGVGVSPDTVTKRIALLRKSLSNDKQPHDRYIASVRNQGYRFLSVVKEINTTLRIKHVTLLVVLLTLMSFGVFLWWSIKDTKNNQQSIKVNAITYSEDFIEKGWRYLRRFDAKNNRLAIEMFEKSLQKKPENLDGLVGLSFALSHEVSKYNQSNNLLTQAILLAKKAIQLYPDSASSWNALGSAYDVRGDIDSALLFYKKALEINPQDSSIQANIAYLRGIKGELIQSLKLNLQVLDSGLEYSNLQMAENLHLLGFVELADQWYKRADILSPDNVFASSQRVKFLISNHRYQEAQLLLDKAKARRINRPETFTLQGILHLIQDDKELALNSFKKALTINNEDFEVQVWILVLSNNVENKLKIIEELWVDKLYYWPSDEIIKMISYAALGERELVMASLKSAVETGFMDSQWLLQLPPLKPYLSDSEFLFWIDQIQQKADSQRRMLLTVDWLPIGFLDPFHSPPPKN